MDAVYNRMNTTKTISQIEINKAIIQSYFEAYNNKDEAIFDEIKSPEYVDHVQSAALYGISWNRRRWCKT
jgi:hypothetical protein